LQFGDQNARAASALHPANACGRTGCIGGQIGLGLAHRKQEEARMAECFAADGVAVITGGASGIGRAAARRAAAAGMKIALVDINAAKLATIGAELAGVVGGANLVVERVDVSDTAAMLGFARQVEQQLG